MAHGHYMAGRLDEAERVCRQILDLHPDHPVALHLLGDICRQTGRTELAVEMLEKAALLLEDAVHVLCSLGIALMARGQLDEAITAFRRGLDQQPDNAVILANLGAALTMRGEDKKGAAILKRALRIEPASATVHKNLGISLSRKGAFEEASEHFEQALKINPGDHEAQAHAGTLRRQRGDYAGARDCYRRSLEIKPNFAAFLGMGELFDLTGDLASALDFYCRALAINPNDKVALAGFFWLKQRTCSWEDFESLKAKIEAWTKNALAEGREPAQHPFQHLATSTDPTSHFELARLWAKSIVARTRVLARPERKPGGSKLTVGYLSGDFNNHPIAHLTLAMYGLHDRRDFVIRAYSFGVDDGSVYRRKIEADCDTFVDIRGLDDNEAAQRISADGVDILVDLTGYTKGTRLGICARRPAPVQVSYLGYPATIGADFFDYFITDLLTTPRSQAPYFSEMLVFLPHCYVIHDNSEPISDKSFSRAEQGLPEKAFVFSSFNQPFKIEPAIFAVWMNILKQVPDSVLWLLVGNEPAAENLKRLAQSLGVAARRLVFAERLVKEQHLARQKLADLALDTVIYNGGVTTSDALWVGVPVIAVLGSHMPSRAAASKLMAIGLPELVADNLDDYERLALRLAGDAVELRKIRRKLAANRLKAPLFDTPRQVGNLEWAYQHMWRDFQAGRWPRSFVVEESC